MKVLDSAERAAGESLPRQAGGNESVLEGTYRLLNNEHFAPETVVGVHQDRTVDRAQAFEVLVVSHDATTLEFQRGPGSALRARTGVVRSLLVSDVALG
jgi:hypothetical protein